VRVQITNDFADRNLYDSWNEILSQPENANVQLTHEWLSTWWEVFGDNKKLLLITITEGDRIVGIVPLTISKVMGKAGLELRKLTFVGDGLTDYHDLLIADTRRKEALQVLSKFVVNCKDNWDVIHFRNVRGSSPNLSMLRDTFEDTSLAFFERINTRCPYISIDGAWTDYYDALGKNIRSDIRRRTNRLAQMGTAEFVRLHQVEDVPATLNTVKSIHIKCQQAKGETSWFTDEKRFRFTSLILERLGERKWLDIVFLKLNDRIIAYYLGFVYAGVVYFWNTGYDPEFSKQSPGKLLLHYWIKDSFERGYKAFDFMVGTEPYKLQWTNRMAPNYEILGAQRTVRSNLLKYYYKYKPILKRNPYLRKIGIVVRSTMKE
jgi:CelD/BcsL family acetyltransferase involved in cellulose biosynthesis